MIKTGALPDIFVDSTCINIGLLLRKLNTIGYPADEEDAVQCDWKYSYERGMQGWQEGAVKELAFEAKQVT